MCPYDKAMNNASPVGSDLDLFFELSPDLLCIASLDGFFKRLNPAYTRVLGFTAEELMGRPFLEFVHPEDRRDTLEAMSSLGAGGRITGFENRYLCRDGSHVWLSWNSMPQKERGLIFAVARDVTAQKLAEEKLRQSGRLLAEAQRIARLGSWEWDLAAGQGSWSEETYRIIGHDRALPVLDLHRFIGERVLEEDRADLLALLTRVERDRRPFEALYRVRHPQAGVRWLRSRGEVQVDAADRPSRLVGTIQDVTEQRQVQERIAKSERLLAQTQRIARLGSWERNLQTGEAVWSAETYAIFGLDPARPIPAVQAMIDRIHPEDRPALAAQLERTEREGQPFDMVYRVRGAGQVWLWVRGRGEARREERTGAVIVLGTIQDVTEQQEAMRRLALAAQVWENSVEGVVVTNAQGTVTDVNRAFNIITGYTPEEVVGAKAPFLRRGQPGWDRRREIIRSLRRHGEWRGELWARSKEGQAYPLWLTVTAIRDAQGRPARYVGLLHDLSDLRRSEEELRYQAQHDALTGLPNRALLYDRLQVAINHAAHRGSRLAVLFVDLDNFKTINDSLGHQAGDELIKEAARRLKRRLGPEVSVARLGGDDFIVVLEDVARTETAAATAEKIQEHLGLPYQLADQELFVTTSIGITLFPEDGPDAQTLVKNAEMAMYRAKAEGKNRAQLFTPALNEQMHKRLALETNLRRALERQEFLLHYQPIIDASTGGIPGCEALVRWARPGVGLVSPGDFIPIAEDTGLILPIGVWVLHAACRQVQAWREAGRDLSVSVNLSARQFLQPDLVDVVEEALRESGLPAGRLELEITESALMLNVAKAVGTMARLTGLGVKLALDDFGTGYSSLTYLKNFPISALKVDQQFVRGVPDDPDDAAIVTTIVGMAKSLKLSVVAEGVETPAQLGFLRGLGCQYMQGYHFSRPLPAEQFAELLAKRPAPAGRRA